ncbi:MAG: YrdB family protein [Chloroflexi bacterium]|nr:YrdB family protein [Chloroflexota bacterium]
MGSHPINLAVRFLLEIAGLIAIGYWGWHQGEGGLSIIFAIGLPVIAAGLWGTFAVPEDPSRSGKAPVPIPGILRLALETAFFGFATWTLYQVGAPLLGLILVIVVLLHYAFSYDRLLWLAKQR